MKAIAQHRETRRHWANFRLWLCVTLTSLVIVVSTPATAALELGSARLETLPNGLTVILLEDRNLPVASVQMLYRVGARNESTGLTGLAHFLEHMAFRSSENFPGTGLVSSIYARGGEWHGYTWTDETTYFATVPAEHLDLLLRIEADRMQRLTISPDVIEAERGAVLAEMHMYENYPTSMLIDALMFTSFLAHPYRNNTIGWESDIAALRHADVVQFYEQHYHPANAVLAVVGDFDGESVLRRIEALFAGFAAQPATPLPHTIEPLQAGERRVRIAGPGNERRFMIGYRAPSVNNPDFAAFLVLQELLGTGSGVSFLQNDWGTPVGPNSLLAGSAGDLTTWFPPSAQDYIFVIGGTAADGVAEPDVENSIEENVRFTRQHDVAKTALAEASARVLDELVFDVTTTEDAAHQLAYFAGMGALDTLLTLPQQVVAITPADVRRVAQKYLQPKYRTVAWYVPGNAGRASQAAQQSGDGQPQITHRQPTPPDRSPLPPPVVRRLSGGISLLVQESDLSSSFHMKIVLPYTALDGASGGDPVAAHSALNYSGRPLQLEAILDRAANELSLLRWPGNVADEPSSDPETRLAQLLGGYMATSTPPADDAPKPAVIVLSGDIDAQTAHAALDKRFGRLAPANAQRVVAATIQPGSSETARLGVPTAQAQLAYIASAPGPREPAYAAFRILLYVLSHGYEGRLGKEAISNRGLAYYIDSRYRSDGQNGWITLAAGVDPGKIEPLEALLRAELARLADEPPTIAEIEEAKTHFIGRKRSAAQSNEEIAEAMATEWLWFGDLDTSKSLERRLAGVSRDDVVAVVPAFTAGRLLLVRE